MRIAQSRPLFAWDDLPESLSLQAIQELLASVPDAKLLASLRDARGRGRNEYPVHVLWGCVLLTIILRHASYEACLEELRRHLALRRLIGIEAEHEVPKKWNLSRFLEVLGQEPHARLLQECFAAMIGRLGAVVPDLGRDTAGDATGLSARRKDAAGAAEEEAQGLPLASGGRKEYTDEHGTVTRVVAWTGFKLHLLVDVKHEVALAYQVTDTKAGDAETLPEVLDQAQAVLPEGRIKTLAFDKAADTEAVHERLSDDAIKAVIQNRSLWQEEQERMLPGHDGNSNIVYDEAGTLYCYDRVSEPMVRHPMAYIGYEPDREKLKYRCPAKHAGWDCPMSTICNAGKSYGLTVRVPREIDWRRFPALPRSAKKFTRLYKGRTAVERVNARVKIFWGADDGNVVGTRRFLAQVGAVMIVHAAFATLLAAAPRREGTLGKMRLSPIAQALRAKLAGQHAPRLRPAATG